MATFEQGSPANATTGFSGIIDTRVIGKPSNFSGSEDHWAEWAFVFMCYVGCLPGDIDGAMKSVESRKEEVNFQEMGERHTQQSKQL